MAPTDPSQAALRMAERLGVLRLRDARAEGIHPEVLRRLARQGQLVKIARGIYAPASADLSTHHDLALASARVPHGTICMLSALSYHEIGTQLPHEVWMMIDRRSRKPRIDRPAMRFVLASGPALALGIEQVEINGATVRIFNPAKTVVDCFRYRRHIGLEAAIEAMRETLRQRRGTPSQIDEYARQCRVASVIRPYLEAIA
ncbi:MAG: type IV toxin-antitoxin system AbiEi family antitoxin domain-containing protein [Planctomycetes bacterium]|nr:type IV toxin-antitoxin system AbiEi family antitoxin domain-containing protein [Planctomycetota bacterium]